MCVFKTIDYTGYCMVWHKLRLLALVSLVASSEVGLFSVTSELSPSSTHNPPVRPFWKQPGFRLHRLNEMEGQEEASQFWLLDYYIQYAF